MTPKEIARIAPLVKDSNSWDAFLTLLNYEQDKITSKLLQNTNSESLIGIAAIYSFIQNLRKLRDQILDREKN